MPKVPTIQPGQVQTRALPGARFTTRSDLSAFGGNRMGVAKAAGDLIETVSNTIQVEKKKANDAAVEVRDSERQKKLNEIVKDFTNNQLKKNADDNYEEYKEKISNIYAEFDKDITPDQRVLWDKRTARSQLDVDSVMQSHLIKERRSYAVDEMRSSLDNIQDDIVSNYNIPNKIEEGLNRQAEVVNHLADTEGWSDESRNKALNETASSTHTMVISRMLTNDEDQKANTYFKENKDMMTARDIQKMESALREGSIRGEAQRQTDKIFEQELTESQALEQARLIEDPEVRDDTVRRVRQRYQEQRQVDENRSRVLYEKSFNAVDANPTRDAIPPDEWNLLKPSQKNAIDALIKRKRTGDDSTDFEVYYDLETMASNPNTRNKFLKMDLLQKRHKLSDADFRKFSKMQADGRKGDMKPFDGVQTKSSIYNNALRELGIPTGARADKEETKKGNLFKRQADILIIQKQEDLGRKLTNEEIQKVTDDLMVNVITDEGIIFDTEKRVFELDPGDSAAVQYDDVPQAARGEISKVLRRKGIPVTNDNILKVYSERLNQLRGKLNAN